MIIGSRGLSGLLGIRQARRRLAGLLALMLASALTEGFGLVLLVPMLVALGGAGHDSAILQAVAHLGIPVELGPLLVLFVALALLRAAINFGRMLAGQRFEIAIVDSLRARAWMALLRCDWRVLAGRSRSESASMLITNIDRVGHGVENALNALTMLVTLGGVGLAALAISPRIALAAIAGGVVVLVAYRGMRRRANELGEALSDAYSDVFTQFNEGLGALRVIKTFGREDDAAARGTRAISGMRQAQLTYVRDAGLSQIALQGGGAILLALLVWVAIVRWHAGVTEILPLVALFARALPLLGALQQAWQNWAYARPAIGATFALIAEAEAAREPDPDPRQEPPRLEHAIVLEAATVRFAGRDQPALSAVDLELPKGSVTAITGPSGAGKSTLADILGGLIEPDEGRMLIDGAPVAGGLRRAWRARVTYVQQEPVLFSGTVRDNLLWADPQADEARMREALDAASAGFVLALPDGLDALVGEGGRELSGGERQRIVLARALLRDPALLILDEAASALDAENEAAIAQAIARLRTRLTIVIIGHRGALAAMADRVVRLEHGRLDPQRA